MRAVRGAQAARVVLTGQSSSTGERRRARSASISRRGVGAHDRTGTGVCSNPSGGFTGCPERLAAACSGPEPRRQRPTGNFVVGRPVVTEPPVLEDSLASVVVGRCRSPAAGSAATVLRLTHRRRAPPIFLPNHLQRLVAPSGRQGIMPAGMRPEGSGGAFFCAQERIRFLHRASCAWLPDTPRMMRTHRT